MYKKWLEKARREKQIQTYIVDIYIYIRVTISVNESKYVSEINQFQLLQEKGEFVIQLLWNNTSYRVFECGFI